MFEHTGDRDGHDLRRRVGGTAAVIDRASAGAREQGKTGRDASFCRLGRHDTTQDVDALRAPTVTHHHAHEHVQARAPARARARACVHTHTRAHVHHRTPLSCHDLSDTPRGCELYVPARRCNNAIIASVETRADVGHIAVDTTLTPGG